MVCVDRKKAIIKIKINKRTLLQTRSMSNKAIKKHHRIIIYLKTIVCLKERIKSLFLDSSNNQ